MADIQAGTVLKDASAGAALGSVIPGVGTLIGGAGGALVGLATGFFGKKKANSILKNNPYPNEGMAQEQEDNEQIAKGAALQGMPSEQYQEAQKTIQRNQAAAVSAASSTPGGAVRNIGAIQQGSNDANAQLTAQSAEMRRQNISQLIGVNNTGSSWRDKLFDWNQRQKYIQQYNYGMSLLGQSNQNIMSGADKLLGTAAGAAASGVFGGRGAAAAPAASSGGGYTPGIADTGGGSAPSIAGQFGDTISSVAPDLLNM